VRRFWSNTDGQTIRLAADFKELLRMERDPGITNICNLDSKHWKRWLGIEDRCVVPFTAFNEFNRAAGGDIWFALNEKRPLACFAGRMGCWSAVGLIEGRQDPGKTR
jgi:putative SOS response-associated peptidase YedK